MQWPGLRLLIISVEPVSDYRTLRQYHLFLGGLNLLAPLEEPDNHAFLRILSLWILFGVLSAVWRAGGSIGEGLWWWTNGVWDLGRLLFTLAAGSHRNILSPLSVFCLFVFYCCCLAKMLHKISLQDEVLQKRPFSASFISKEKWTLLDQMPVLWPSTPLGRNRSPSCFCMNAVQGLTLCMSMACKAEAACPAAL